jgi:hypothetical protein
MSLELNIAALKNFKSVKDDQTMSFNADLNLKFYVNASTGDELAIEIVLKDFLFTFQALINNMMLHPKLMASSISKIEIVSSTIGDFDTKEIIALYQQVFGYALAPVNAYIATLGLTVPEKIFGLFSLSNLQLIYHDDFIEGLVTPTFIAPTKPIFKPKYGPSE